MMSNLTDAYLHDFEIIDEYKYYQMPSSQFSYHKHPDPKHKGKYLDDGTCEICGKKHTYLLIDKDKPHMCYNCYQAIRAYQSLLIDVLRVKKKKNLNLKDCKRVVKYMKSYAKQKAIAMGLVGLALAAAVHHDLNS